MTGNALLGMFTLKLNATHNVLLILEMRRRHVIAATRTSSKDVLVNMVGPRFHVVVPGIDDNNGPVAVGNVGVASSSKLLGLLIATHSFLHVKVLGTNQCHVRSAYNTSRVMAMEQARQDPSFLRAPEKIRSS